MRHGFRWATALLVLALMLPAAAGALPAARVSFRSEGWNPWNRIVAFVTGLFGASEETGKVIEGIEAGCGIDGVGVPKCTN